MPSSTTTKTPSVVCRLFKRVDPKHSLSRDDIVFETMDREDLEKKVYNNVTKIWNHTFYWSCMTQIKLEQPTAAFKKSLAAHFGSFDDFMKGCKNVTNTPIIFRE
jgi:superoxide dismutase